MSALSGGLNLVIAEQQQLPQRSGARADPAQASSAGDFRSRRRQGRRRPPRDTRVTKKLGHFLVLDPLPEADRMHPPPGPHHGMHARGTEHCPSRSSKRSNIGHATTIRSGTDRKD